MSALLYNRVWRWRFTQVRYRAQHEAEKDAAMKQFEAFKKSASAKQNKMREEFDDKLQSMMEQSKAALKDFQEKTKSFADIMARLENQVRRCVIEMWCEPL